MRILFKKILAIVQRWLSALLVVPVACLIVFGIWAAVSAALENIRFAQATDQVLQLVATARDYAAHTPVFATQLDDDVLGALNHAAIINVMDGVDHRKKLENVWGGNILATVVEPSVMRVEGDMPTHDCRRMALFLINDAKDLQLEVMEARGLGQKTWQRFYDGRSDVGPASSRGIDSACGGASFAVLALVFRLR